MFFQLKFLNPHVLLMGIILFPDNSYITYSIKKNGNEKTVQQNFSH